MNRRSFLWMIGLTRVAAGSIRYAELPAQPKIIRSEIQRGRTFVWFDDATFDSYPLRSALQADASSEIGSKLTLEWRNWQQRRTQNPVAAKPS